MKPAKQPREHECHQHPVAEWTVLIYQASDNNLSEDSMYSLGEMNKAIGRERAKAKQAKRSAKVEIPPLYVVAQLDPVGRGNATRVFELTKYGPDLEDKVIDEFDRETDTNRPDTLIEFLSKYIRCYPARHYMLVLAGHGAGVLNGFFLEDDSRRLTSVPSAFQIRFLKDVFENDEVRDALGNRKIDILGFDSCMMSMIEICYQLLPAEKVDLVIGSEGFSLNSGWPYETIVSKLQQGVVNAESLAKEIVTQHIDYYADYYLGGLSVDISALRMSQIPVLKTLIDELARAMEQALTLNHYDERGETFQDAILLAHWGAQSYNGEQCVDLYDFCYLLRKRVKEAQYPDVYRSCRNVMRAIWNRQENRATTVVRTDYSGPAFQYSHGLSIYLPWSSFDIAPEYRGLRFAKQGADPSPWLSFLEKYTGATRRRARHPLKLGRREVGVRSTPPYSKGPDGVVRSMRNPPVGF